MRRAWRSDDRPGHLALVDDGRDADYALLRGIESHRRLQSGEFDARQGALARSDVDEHAAGRVEERDARVSGFAALLLAVREAPEPRLDGVEVRGEAVLGRHAERPVGEVVGDLGQLGQVDHRAAPPGDEILDQPDAPLVVVDELLLRG